MQSPTAKWWTKNRPAFTLLETVVVLAIVCLMIALPSFCMTKVRQRASMRQAMVLVTSQIEYDKRYALVSGLPVQIDYDPDQHVLTSKFYRAGKASHVQLPRDVQVKFGSTNRLCLGTRSCPAQTIKFLRGDEKNEVTMQLEWGKLRF
jgi:competence protein ComGD